MATVCLQLQEFTPAYHHVNKGLECEPESKDFASLKLKIERADAKFKKKEKKVLTKMFGGSRSEDDKDAKDEPVVETPVVEEVKDKAIVKEVTDDEDEASTQRLWKSVSAALGYAQYCCFIVVAIGVLITWYYDNVDKK